MTVRPRLTRGGTPAALRHVLRLANLVDRGAVALVGVLAVAYAVSIPAIAVGGRWLVDAAAHRALWAVIAAAAVASVGHVIRAACHRIQVHLQGDLADRVDVRLSTDILRLTAGIPTIAHLDRPEYLDRITALRRGTRALAQAPGTLVDTVVAALSLVLSVLLLASISPLVSGLALLAIPPLLLRHRGERVVRAALDRTASHLRQEEQLHTLCTDPAAAPEIWIADSGRELSVLADAAWTANRRGERSARLLAAMLHVAGWSCYAAGLAAALLFVVDRAGTGQATPGDVVLVILLALRLRLQVSDAVNGAAEMMSVVGVATDYAWLRDYAARQPTGALPTPGRISTGLRMAGVGFRYPGQDRDALAGLDLSVPPGTTVGVVGLNGAGKSTLVNLLLGLHRPTQGEIRLDGLDIAALDPVAWYACNTATFQDFAKFRLPAGTVVGLGDLTRVSDCVAVGRALDLAGAADVVASLPDGVNTQLGGADGGVELSHGQWQRLAVARALMRPGPLLTVLDEPTAGLDPSAEHDVFQRCAALATAHARRNGGITVLISHRFSSVHMADLIVVLTDGRIAEVGSHRELMAAGSEYADLYRLQAAAYQQTSSKATE